MPRSCKHGKQTKQSSEPQPRGQRFAIPFNIHKVACPAPDIPWNDKSVAHLDLAPPRWIVQELEQARGTAQRTIMLSAFDSTFWNLVQTLGWIYLGDRNFVEEAGQPDARLNQMMLLITAEQIDTRYPSLGEAKEDLCEALRAGAVTAVGLLDNRGDPRPVPAVFWTHGKFYEDPEVAGPTALLPTSSLWHGLRFSRVEVLRRWPAPAPAPQAIHPPVRAGAAATLTFEQLAGRWLAEVPDTGLKADNLSVDLVRLAELGAFVSEPDDVRPRRPHFDPRLGKHIHIFDQRGEPAAPYWISNFARSGRPGSEWNQRLIAARDLSIELPAFATWLESEAGKAWAVARGLRPPRFYRDAAAGPSVAIVRDVTRCHAWLVEMMKAGDADRSKSDVFAEAQMRFRISKYAFNGMWPSAVRESGNETWSKPGRRRRKD